MIFNRVGPISCILADIYLITNPGTIQFGLLTFFGLHSSILFICSSIFNPDTLKHDPISPPAIQLLVSVSPFSPNNSSIDYLYGFAFINNITE